MSMAIQRIDDASFVEDIARPAAADRPLHVLVIEDSDIAVERLLDELRAGGYDARATRVETVWSMAAALDRQRWDLVIADPALPQLDVLAALQLLKERRLTLPFLMLAGRTAAGHTVTAVKTDAQTYRVDESPSPLLTALGRFVAPAASPARRPASAAPPAAAEQHGHAAALIRLAARLNADLELEEVLAIVCQESAAALHLPLAAISLYDKRRDAFVHAGDYGWPPEYRGRIQPVPRAIYAGAIEQRDPLVVVPDIQTVADLPNAEVLARLSVRSTASTVVVRDDRPVAVLSVASTEHTRLFAEAELTLLRGLAHQAAQAIIGVRLAREARRRAAYLQAQRAIEIATSASLDLRLTLDVVLTQITAQLRVDAVDILLLNNSAGMLEYAGGRGFFSTSFHRFRLHPGEGYAGRAALERCLISIPKLEQANQHFGRARLHLLAAEGFVAYHAAPLIAKGQVKGVLEIFHRSPLETDAEWLSFLEALATQAAIAIDNAALFNDLQRSNAELTLAYDATIEGWSRTLELRDEETQGHTIRVTDLTLRLAHAMGMAKSELPHLRRGALLHDIGKMAIPDQILRKQGPLTEEEWAIMRRHPVYAYELLSPIAFLRPALDIPYCHHEKWDGSGYPRGLMGAQIPISARIFAVADIWDALHSDRPYRPGWSEDLIRAHLRELAGSHLDPQVVEVFLQAILGDRPSTGMTGMLQAI